MCCHFVSCLHVQYNLINPAFRILEFSNSALLKIHYIGVAAASPRSSGYMWSGGLG